MLFVTLSLKNNWIFKKNNWVKYFFTNTYFKMIVGPASETTGQREMTSVIFLTCRNNSYIRG